MKNNLRTKNGKYIFGKNSKFAFVSTNSINQGEQVPMLWKDIFSLNLEIGLHSLLSF